MRCLPLLCPPSGKSRLLLQVCYSLAASPSTAADPFQPLLLILPKRRNMEEAARGDVKGGPVAPIMPLFGATQLDSQVLNRIQIK